MRAFKFILGSLITFALFAAQGCTDPNAIVDQNTPIDNHNWSYVNRIKVDVKIDNISVPYNLYFNVRVSGNYRYSNIFALLRQTSPGKKTQTTRYEWQLANKDGEWLGSGSGNIYSYQLPLRTNYKFPAKGVYHFEIEQNMRDNPLHEVIDAGLRVEKVR
ncbi:gliding motility lipoprotein GldH [Mucilaginibacter sp. AK015]|uniref:gliding motility lipoprotein GldH n=1 Tax=Mucilaginibacter sp. AK015 TaxID=2723072 RepID=UPI00160EECFE|nr:gliding motility lipoprotein GldH [Mucilaginibacter sp. AK015]MBB5397277.1 gliding motility-associated lipoprotein GldH [Mucilaginibacter sp. AK015]